MYGCLVARGTDCGDGPCQLPTPLPVLIKSEPGSGLAHSHFSAFLAVGPPTYVSRGMVPPRLKVVGGRSSSSTLLHSLRPRAQVAATHLGSHKRHSRLREWQRCLPTPNLNCHKRDRNFYFKMHFQVLCGIPRGLISQFQLTAPKSATAPGCQSPAEGAPASIPQVSQHKLFLLLFYLSLFFPFLCAAY